jgi:hypothetical protein
MCILLSSPWNFLQNRTYLRAQSKPQQIYENRKTFCILSDHNAIKLELNNKSNSRKYANNWRLSDTLHNNQWIIEEIREEIKRLLEVNENESNTYQNLWDTGKAVQRRKFIDISAHNKRTERSQINDLMLHFKLLKETRTTNLKTNRRRETIKIRAGINEIETKKNTKNQQNKKLVLLKNKQDLEGPGTSD